MRLDDETVMNLLGLAYFKQENFRQADDIYRKLIETNPDSYTLHFNLGLICFKLGDLDRAEATFLRALELRPDNQKTHFYLGNIYEKKHQYYNAIFQYRKAGANIMVKRVQNKIDLERPSDRAHGEDFTVKTPAQGTMPGSSLTQPQPAVEVPDTDVDSQEGGEAKTAPGMDRVTVNSIDRKRILTALEPEARGQAPATPSEPPRAGDDTRPSLRSLETTQPRGAPPDKREPAIRQEPPPPDTRDTEATPLREVAPPLDRSPGADEAAEAAAKVQGKRPDETAPPRTLDPQPVPTRMRLTEPIIEDQSLAEMIRSKTPTDVGEELFSDDSTRQPTIVLVLTVQEDYPINVSSSNLIAWSGDLSPVIVNDQAIAELMLPSASSGPNVRLEGNGKVMMEKSAP